VRALRRAADSGALQRITRAGEVDQILTTLMSTPWVVYAKPCLSHAQSVLGYLARYTHRIAISDQRITAIDDTHVHFTYKDTRDGRTRKTMALDGEEFVRRYLQHILPKGLMRIRHYGFLANRRRRQALSQIRAALAEPVTAAEPPPLVMPPFAGFPCPCCAGGWMVVIVELAPRRDRGSG
jgi:hypothetical protein